MTDDDKIWVVVLQVGRAAKSWTAVRPGWAVGGLATLVIVTVIASSNLSEIYQSQKDFVAGSLLSLAGFCFGKALSHTHEQKALELIRDAPTDEVNRTLQREARLDLHARGAFEYLARLEQDIQATVERIGRFYDSQCRNVERYSGLAGLREVLDDLDRASDNGAALRCILDTATPADRAYPIEAPVRLALASIARDYREAIGRRDQTYDWYAKQLADREDEIWDLFAVMTSDMLKGERMLSALLGRSVRLPPAEYLRLVNRYLHASLNRAQEFMAGAGQRNVPPPKVFDVMVQDLNRAIEAIGQIESAEDPSPMQARSSG